ncbi:uncharacterized protein GGS22DRAFT_161091 [Annulohypoxylon maeteangense]|uniref:uncharacterized protein n=1 Tax=Annulohypoxylon maeteangense TaxID=1927788 RepID=UPI002007BE6E|nr:uncharacterized protein GGS22DRAFT_161091 [Annulohypoxylon maeteangense]KAI0885507.1 hypothetical protein GGS22DRAFT_161091 [Annulohypoxylon maeteangense]
MAKPKAITGLSTRPLNAVFLLAFSIFAAVFTYLMRVDTVINEVPTNFHPVVETSTFENGTPLVTQYTGVKAVDELAKFLVAAFLAGPAGWDVGVKAQQAYFLMNFFAVVSVWAVESSRRRNSGRLISFVALFGLLYQIIGAAIIAPVYYTAYVFTSRGDAYHLSGREVPIGYARALLPATVLGYLIPTMALYYGSWDIQTVQYLTAFWQPSPIYVSVLLVLLSYVTSPSSSTTTAKNGDVKHLKLVYLLVGLISSASHLSTLYLSFTSDNPQLSLSYIFLPNRATWKDGIVLGLHYIFQVDFFGAFGSALLWSWLNTYDVLRVQGRSSASSLIQAALGIVITTLVAGPGTAIVVAYNWRENVLVAIENANGKKPKAA